MSQALVLADIAKRAAKAASGSGGEGNQAVLADLHSLHSTAVSMMEEWVDQINFNTFWFYNALRFAGHVLCDMIGRFEEALDDPSKARAALDGLVVLPEIADIIASASVRPSVDDRDREEMIDKKMALWEKAFAAGLVKTVEEDIKKLGPGPKLTEHDTPETRPDIIWVAYDNDTNEVRCLT